MKQSNFKLILLAAAMTAPGLATADDDEREFDEAFLYFELNDTDGDLGIHGKVDGDGWKKVEIESPDDRKLLQLKVKSGLKRQGMTELFFESSEPTFDILEPEVFFARFPEGLYEWEGKTLDNEEIEGEIFLSHRIPAAPVVGSVGGADEPEEAGECWGYPGEGDVIVDWNPVTHTHASLGSEFNVPLGENSVLYYEFVAEIDDNDYQMATVIPPGTTVWTIPEAFIDLVESQDLVDEDGEPIEEIKFEIIVRVETGAHMDDDGEEVDSRPGNQSAVESCFAIVEGGDDDDDEE